MIVKMVSVENVVIFERDMGVSGTRGCSLCGQRLYRLVEAEQKHSRPGGHGNDIHVHWIWVFTGRRGSMCYSPKPAPGTFRHLA